MLGDENTYEQYTNSSNSCCPNSSNISSRRNIRAMTTGHSAFAWKQDSYKKRGDDSDKKRGDDSYKKDKQDGYKKQRQDTYMKGGENSYKKVRQSKGIYGNGNTETIQATTQNGQVRGSHNTLEQEASNVICTHPSATCSQDGSEASVASNDNCGTNRDNGDNSQRQRQRR